MTGPPDRPQTSGATPGRAEPRASALGRTEPQASAPDTPDRRLLARLGADPGLCARCLHLRLLASPRSVFVRCARAATDPRFPRYPALPVLACAGYEPDPGAAR